MILINSWIMGSDQDYPKHWQPSFAHFLFLYSFVATLYEPNMDTSLKHLVQDNLHLGSRLGYRVVISWVITILTVLIGLNYGSGILSYLLKKLYELFIQGWIESRNFYSGSGKQKCCSINTLQTRLTNLSTWDISRSITLKKESRFFVRCILLLLIALWDKCSTMV